MKITFVKTKRKTGVISYFSSKSQPRRLWQS